MATNDIAALKAKFGVGAAAEPGDAAPPLDDLKAKFGITAEPSAAPVPRQFNNTGSIEQIRADIAGDKAAIDAADTAGQKSRANSFGRGAMQGGSLGFGDEIAAAADTAVSKVPGLRNVAQALHSEDLPPLTGDATYQQRRDAYRAKNAQAQSENPGGYAVGEAVGSLAVPVPGSVVVKGAGAAKNLAALAKTGAVLGGAAGLGHSEADLTKGEIGQAVKDTAKGAAVGAVVTPVIAGAGKLVGKAADKLRQKYVETFGSEVLGMARPRDVAAWKAILGKRAEEGVEKGAAEKFIRSSEMEAVEKAAHAKDYEGAIKAVNDNLARLSPGRAANYAAVSEAGEFEVGKGLEQIVKHQIQAGQGAKNPQVADALAAARKNWIRDYATADAGTVQRTLLHPPGVEPQVADELERVVNALPQSGNITRTAVAKAVAQENPGLDTINFLEKHVLDPRTGVMRWNPKATIPAVEIRAAASNAQQKANQALGMLNQTLHHETKTAVKDAVETALEDYLDATAAKSPELARVVKNIRNDDVKFSVLLQSKTGLNQAIAKTSVSELKAGTALHHALRAGGAALALHSADGLTELPEDIKHGRYLRAALHAGEAAAGAALLGRGALRAGSRAFNRVENAAGRAEPRVRALIKDTGGGGPNPFGSKPPSAAAFEEEPTAVIPRERMQDLIGNRTAQESHVTTPIPESAAEAFPDEPTALIPKQTMKELVAGNGPGMVASKTMTIKPADAAKMAQDSTALELMKLKPAEFRARVEKEGISVPMYRGHRDANDPGVGWFASDPKTAATYAGKYSGTEGVVTPMTVTLKRPYVASGTEMINATSGTIDRLKKEGYDGIVTQWRTLSIGNHPAESEIYAIPFER